MFGLGFCLKYGENYKKKFFSNKNFIFGCVSKSKKNVIRGLHLQRINSQAKYISVLKGKIFDVALDLRKKSKTYGKYFSSILSESNSKSIYIPAGFAHGYCGLENENYIIYSCSKYRNSKSEIGISYNDKEINIKWPTKKPIVSKKDRNNFSFSFQIFKCFFYKLFSFAFRANRKHIHTNIMSNA